MIEAETKYTYENYKKYYWFSLFRGKYYRLKMAAFPIAMIYVMISAVLSFIWYDKVWLSVLLVCASMFGVIFFALTTIMPKRYVKQSPAIFQTSMRLVFHEESFSVTQMGEMTSGSSIVKYEALNKVYETSDMFYLYISPVQAYILPKSDFVKGWPDELSGLLQAKLPERKYVLCK